MVATKHLINILEKYVDISYADWKNVNKFLKDFLNKLKNNKKLDYKTLINGMRSFCDGNHIFASLISKKDIKLLEQTISTLKNKIDLELMFEGTEDWWNEEGEFIPIYAMGDLVEGMFYSFLTDIVKTGFEYSKKETYIKEWLNNIYMHYKGNYYQILNDEAILENTMEKAVIYKSIFNETVWIRPHNNFFETFDLNNKKINRFNKIS